MIIFCTGYLDLNFYLDTDKDATTRNEGATLTCRASIEFPPFTMLSLIKNRQTVATSSGGMLEINTKTVNANPFGVYTCRLNASGKIFEETTFLKEQGLQPVGIVGQSINNLIICDHKLCSLYQADDREGQSKDL